ncbi:hypothetical protein SARC_08168 [Sphaeroforma arctica JP610]|uniref:U2A'/phosphoprotein 32 family A C-terminal domain-containing protein n=1 Tax=Sphaeroforma arctica JP610 TaxID=667725 RepID=A0A0L0FRI3_9EUKA|nr:hypothetical protein SARC_08168 [Sphaeroforma arctica JP610]KNC79437.1 hypothetical protein SARC_08168 [Sphaeroforma arctica JP610]|eukprot:XP_014153339.1 hypothetical protein SARC_08168 [Sphaeroforma arctica JP610]
MTEPHGKKLGRYAEPTSHLVKLTLPKVAELGGGDIREMKTLVASNKGFQTVVDLSPMVEIRKLTLSKNELESLECVKYCKSLTYLNVAHNKIDSLKDLKDLKMLSVCNAGNNNLNSAEGATAIEHLKALVLNNNKFTHTPNFLRLKKLNTLVLSHNMIEDIKAVRYLTALTKFAASHNKIRKIPDVTGLYDLTEIKLNDNLILTVPETIQFAPNLKTIDLGNNRIKKYTDLKHLANLPVLKQLTLKGNPIAASADYREKIAELLPTVEVLDGERFRGRKFIKKLSKEKKAGATSTGGNTSIVREANETAQSEDEEVNTNGEVTNTLNNNIVSIDVREDEVKARRKFEGKKMKLGGESESEGEKDTNGETVDDEMDQDVPEINARRKFVGNKVRLACSDDEDDSATGVVVSDVQKNTEVASKLDVQRKDTVTVTTKKATTHKSIDLEMSQPFSAAAARVLAHRRALEAEMEGILPTEGENITSAAKTQKRKKSQQAGSEVVKRNKKNKEQAGERSDSKRKVEDDFFVSMSGAALGMNKSAPKLEKADAEKSKRKQEKIMRKQERRDMKLAAMKAREVVTVKANKSTEENKSVANDARIEKGTKSEKTRSNVDAGPDTRTTAITGVLKVERKAYNPSVDVDTLMSELGKSEVVAFGESGTGWD